MHVSDSCRRSEPLAERTRAWDILGLQRPMQACLTRGLGKAVEQRLSQWGSDGWTDIWTRIRGIKGPGSQWTSCCETVRMGQAVGSAVAWDVDRQQVQLSGGSSCT